MVQRLFRSSRPLYLILVALTYSLGAGIAHYLGGTVDVVSFLLGLVSIIALQAAIAWLVDYFHFLSVPLEKEEKLQQREGFRVILLQASYAALTLTGAILISLAITSRLNLLSAFFFAVIALVMVAYALPPIHLAELGFGELVLAVFMGTLVPTWAFLLQYGGVHRLLALATFPLSLLALAYFLVTDFPMYAIDLKQEHHSLLTRISWQRAIPVHHFLVLAAFLIFASAPLVGFPWSIIWPVFVALPFAAVQIFWLQRISVGGPTFWNFLIPLSLATFAFTAYLLAFTFWIH
jgi:1,4-dihydroxy-2-naphthoate octaprenyltransferase